MAGRLLFAASQPQKQAEVQRGNFIRETHRSKPAVKRVAGFRLEESPGSSGVAADGQIGPLQGLQMGVVKLQRAEYSPEFFARFSLGGVLRAKVSLQIRQRRGGEEIDHGLQVLVPFEGVKLKGLC